MAYLIRKYVDRDLEELLGVWYRASRLAHPFLAESFLDRERQSIKEAYIPMAETWVYVKEKKVVGFISLLGQQVGGLFVDPAFHKQGIGRALMDLARKLRGQLVLDVFEANVIGRRFYDRYGFVQVGKHAHKETGHPLLRMRLSIDATAR